MREIVHLQAGQCGNQIGAKVQNRFFFNPESERMRLSLNEIDICRRFHFHGKPTRSRYERHNLFKCGSNYSSTYAYP